MLGALAVALAVQAAPAIGTTSADSLSSQAVAESLQVLATLDERVRSHPKDAAAWHRRANVAFALSERSSRPPAPPGLNYNALRRVADVSFQTAIDLAPQDIRLRLDAGTFYLMSDWTVTRTVSYIHFDEALKLARARNDSAGLVNALVDAGRIYWRRYDSFAHRALNNILPAYFQDTVGFGTSIRAIRRGAVQIIADAGEADFLRAQAMFSEAYDLAPSDPRTYSQYAMLLVEGQRWGELAALARDRRRRRPDDGWGFMALGLALHRRGEAVAARATFDTALTRLGPAERGRLDRIERVMRPRAAAEFGRKDALTRRDESNSAWLLADPLWADEGEDPRLEFLARIAYAELRWSVPERRVRGADSDRGDVHIRHGPADTVYTAGPDGGGVVTMYWMYARSELLFAFSMTPSFATATTPFDGWSFVEALKEERPASFHNIAFVRIDTMPAQVARFRASSDSVDLLVAALAPLDEIRSATASNARVVANFWLLGWTIDHTTRDSIVLARQNMVQWVSRVPAGEYLYRIETTSPGALVAGRSSATLALDADTTTGFALSGFGVSDLLLATRAEPVSAPGRWHDFAIRPVLGSVQRGTDVSLVWEVYDAGVVDHTARYGVTVTLARERSAAGRVAMSIVGAITGAVGRRRGDDGVDITFERVVPHAAAIADHVTVSLEDTPPGAYRIAIAVTDRVTGRVTTRGTRIVVR